MHMVHTRWSMCVDQTAHNWNTLNTTERGNLELSLIFFLFVNSPGAPEMLSFAAFHVSSCKHSIYRVCFFFFGDFQTVSSLLNVLSLSAPPPPLPLRRRGASSSYPEFSSKDAHTPHLCRPLLRQSSRPDRIGESPQRVCWCHSYLPRGRERRQHVVEWEQFKSSGTTDEYRGGCQWWRTRSAIHESTKVCVRTPAHVLANTILSCFINFCICVCAEIPHRMVHAYVIFYWLGFRHCRGNLGCIKIKGPFHRATALPADDGKPACFSIFPRKCISVSTETKSLSAHERRQLVFACLATDFNDTFTFTLSFHSCEFHGSKVVPIQVTLSFHEMTFLSFISPLPPFSLSSLLYLLSLFHLSSTSFLSFILPLPPFSLSSRLYLLSLFHLSSTSSSDGRQLRFVLLTRNEDTGTLGFCIQGGNSNRYFHFANYGQ